MQRFYNKNVIIYTGSERVKKILKKFGNVNFIFITSQKRRIKKILNEGGD
jgi:uncharacterized protein YlbG (UPF0298 family)